MIEVYLSENIIPYDSQKQTCDIERLLSLCEVKSFLFNCFQLFTNILYSILVVFFEMEVSLKQPDNLPNCFYLNPKLIQNNQLGKKQ